MDNKNFWKALILGMFISGICYFSFQKKTILSEYNHKLCYFLQDISSSFDKFTSCVEVFDPSPSFRSGYRNGLKNQVGRNCLNYFSSFVIKNNFLPIHYRDWKDGYQAIPIYLSANQLII
jgi:hypothetical protein